MFKTESRNVVDISWSVSSPNGGDINEQIFEDIAKFSIQPP